MEEENTVAGGWVTNMSSMTRVSEEDQFRLTACVGDPKAASIGVDADMDRKHSLKLLKKVMMNFNAGEKWSGLHCHPHHCDPITLPSLFPMADEGPLAAGP